MTGDPWPNGEPEEGPIPGTTYHRGDTVMPVDGIQRGRVLDTLFGGSMLTIKWLGGDVVTVQAETVRPAPRPPEGVSVVDRNGNRVPCEVYYLGMEGALHVWEATAAVDLAQVQRLHLDLLPAKTTVKFRAIEEPDAPTS